MNSTETAHIDTFAARHLPPAEQWPEFLLDHPDVRYPGRCNAAEELLDGSLRRHGGDRPCLLDDHGGRWTYEETRSLVDRIAHVLTDDLGVVPGNRVLLRGPNNPWLAMCWLAVLKAGGVVVTTMPLLRSGEIRAVIDRAQVGLALCDHRFLEDLEAADPALQIVPFGGTGAADLQQRVARKPESYRAVATAATDVALIAFTSGTTGAPKGCMHQHRDVLAIADTFSKHIIRPTPDDLFTGSPPLAFTFGLGQLVIFPLRAGAATLLLEQGAPPRLAAAVREHRATICGTAPTAYRAMLREPDLDLSSLRRAVSAGETLPTSTLEDFAAATGRTLLDGIGATELLHIFISAPEGAIRPGATGRPVPGYEAAILDPEGRELGAGVVGRLAVRGPTGCRYLADERQRDYVQGGWNVTGDAFLRDDDGYYWYQARADDMIISSGYNIAGPEVEDALLSHPGVAEAAVVGVPDDDRGSIVKAFVVLRPDVHPGSVTGEGLQDHVKNTIAPYKYPRAVEFVDALPRTQTGKLQRYRLRASATSGQGGRSVSTTEEARG